MKTAIFVIVILAVLVALTWSAWHHADAPSKPAPGKPAIDATGKVDQTLGEYIEATHTGGVL